MNSPRGFTLVEVMVALAVVAIALPALLVSLYQQVDSTAYLRDKSLAHMVAANKLAEVRLVTRARGRLVAGKNSGVTRMAERDWYWWVESQATDMQQFYRINIAVAAGEDQRDQPLQTLSAFLSSDVAADPGPARSTDPGGGRERGQGDANETQSGAGTSPGAGE